MAGSEDEIAAALSPRIPRLRTRFNVILKCAELHSGKEVAARIAVHGSECAPYRIIVAPGTLPESAKQLFAAGDLSSPAAFCCNALPL